MVSCYSESNRDRSRGRHTNTHDIHAYLDGVDGLLVNLGFNVPQCLSLGDLQNGHLRGSERERQRAGEEGREGSKKERVSA